MDPFDWHSYSDLITVFLRYGGFLIMLLTVVLGVLYGVAWVDAMHGARHSRRRREKLVLEAQWAAVKLFAFGFVGLVAFVISF